VFYGLKAVLDGHSGGGPVLLSQVRQRVRSRRHSSASRIAEVLAEMELLHDDTTAAIRTWIDRHASDLPAGFGPGVHGWLLALLDGDARTRPRSLVTIRVHFGILASFIEQWAATRSHLREITSGDVDTVLEPLRGHRRYNAITALRSLFRFAKRRGLTFADPTRHLSGGRAAEHTATGWQLGALEWVFTSMPKTPPLPNATLGFFPAGCHYNDGTFVPEPSQKDCPKTAPGSGAKFFFWHPDLFTMHVWVWYPNPAGLYSSTNPLVTPFNGG
jgi:hypothetical protein